MAVSEFWTGLYVEIVKHIKEAIEDYASEYGLDAKSITTKYADEITKKARELTTSMRYWTFDEIESEEMNFALELVRKELKERGGGVKG